MHLTSGALAWMQEAQFNPHYCQKKDTKRRGGRRAFMWRKQTWRQTEGWEGHWLLGALASSGSWQKCSHRVWTRPAKLVLYKLPRSTVAKRWEGGTNNFIIGQISALRILQAGNWAGNAIPSHSFSEQDLSRRLEGSWRFQEVRVYESRLSYWSTVGNCWGRIFL